MPFEDLGPATYSDVLQGNEVIYMRSIQTRPFSYSISKSLPHQTTPYINTAKATPSPRTKTTPPTCDKSGGDSPVEIGPPPDGVLEGKVELPLLGAVALTPPLLVIAFAESQSSPVAPALPSLMALKRLW
jgi:hypothetical protein